MKKGIISLWLMFCFISIFAVSIGDLIDNYSIDTALNEINMNRNDLTFQFYKYNRDFYRINMVDSLFVRPMDTFIYTNSLSHKMWENAAAKINYPALIEYSYKQLDVSLQISKKNIPAALPKNIQKSIKKLNPEHQNIMTNIYQSYALIESFYNLSLAQLNEAEKKEILSYFNNEGNDDNSGISYLDLKAWKKHSTETNEKTKKIYQLLKKVNFTYLATASYLCAELVKNVENVVLTSSSSNFKKDKAVIETEFGSVIINPEPNADLSKAIFVLDYQENRVYRQQESNHVLVVLDFAGNDTYFGNNNAQGGALFGIQYFIDYKGDDLYTAKNNSQGSSCLGTGFLIDYEGNDRYIAETQVQGAGKLGVGLLMDINGNDSYECALYGQGFGYVKGFGSLTDMKGNDRYVVNKTHVDWLRYDSHYESLSQGCGLGIRPWFSGGIGLLSDKEGNDLYVSDIYGQGTAYWYAIGGLVDGGGNDQYLSYQYAQGSGVHLAFAALTDYQGDDLYSSKGVSQGCGHDYAFGGLADLAGQDNYVCYDLSQGGGNANAISVFIDAMGDDGYIAKRENTMGYSDLRRSYGYIGLFLDLNGNDMYGSPKGKNNTTWTGSTYGAGLDTNDEELSTVVEQTVSPAKPVDMKIPADLDSLFLLASAQPQALAHLVQPARDKIISMSESAMPYLVSQLKTEEVREQLTLTETIPKIGNKAIPFLVQAAQDSTMASFAISLIGLTKDSTAFDVLTNWLDENNPNYYYALRALQDIQNPRSVPYFIRGLKNSSVSIRRECAIGLQKNPSEEALEPLIDCLDDPWQEVRYSAYTAIEKTPLSNPSYLKNKADLSIGLKRKMLETLAKKKKI